MAHQMTNGGPCGLRDGHGGPHRSVAGVESRREHRREYQREYDRRPEVREHRREYQQSPEVRERERGRDRRRYWTDLKWKRLRKERVVKQAELDRIQTELAEADAEIRRLEQGGVGG